MIIQVNRFTPPNIYRPTDLLPENIEFRDCVLETVVTPEEKVQHEWVPRRPIPREKTWFETGWARFRDGEIYD